MDMAEREETITMSKLGQHRSMGPNLCSQLSKTSQIHVTARPWLA